MDIFMNKSNTGNQSVNNVVKCRRSDRGISPRAGLHCKKGYCKCVPEERRKKGVGAVKMAKKP
jgi:hypothetical protein